MPAAIRPSTAMAAALLKVRPPSRDRCTTDTLLVRRDEERAIALVRQLGLLAV